MDSLQQLLDKILRMESYVQGELKSRDVLSSIVCGSLAGMSAKTVIAPAERVKMSFQVSKTKFTYSAALKSAIEMVKRDGIIGLWKGHSTTLLRVAPYAGISYAVHDYTENWLKATLKVEKLRFEFKFLAGSMAGAVGTICTYPLDVLRVRLALTRGLSWHSAISQGSFYKGLSPTLLGIIPYAGTTWCVKQTINELYPTITFRKPSTSENLVINAFAGLVGQLVTYPLDIVRRRMQMIVAQDPLSVRQFLQTLYREEGTRGLLKGFSLNIVKGPITVSISLTVYDLLQEWVNDKWSWRQTMGR